MATACTTFSLANQSLKLDQASDLDAHIGALQASTSITSIALNGNTIGVPAAEALAAVLATQTSLTRINLADIFTGRLLSEIPPALDALVNALLKCPHLHTVDLSDNAFGLNTVAPLVRFLRQHTPLQHLILNNNGLGPTAGAAVADALHELATKKQQARASSGSSDIPELETIVCGRNRLETGSMAAWARAYGALPGLRSVRMVQNGIRQEGIIQLLSEGLRQCRDLRVLDLQDNTFTHSGSTALAKALPSWPALEELGVGDCLLGGRGFVLVADALSQGSNKNLQVLRAQYDEINTQGIAALVKALHIDNALPSLQRVELNGNKFPDDDAGIVHLQDLLRERRARAGADSDDETWGMDELSDLEEESDEEDEDDEDKEPQRDKVLQTADQLENEKVAGRKDANVDALADALDKKL